MFHIQAFCARIHIYVVFGQKPSTIGKKHTFICDEWMFNVTQFREKVFQWINALCWCAVPHTQVFPMNFNTWCVVYVCVGAILPPHQHHLWIVISSELCYVLLMMYYYQKEGSINFVFTSYTTQRNSHTIDTFKVWTSWRYPQPPSPYHITSSIYSCIFDVIRLLLANSIQLEYMRIRYDDEIKILLHLSSFREERINSISFHFPISNNVLKYYPLSHHQCYTKEEQMRKMISSPNKMIMKNKQKDLRIVHSPSEWAGVKRLYYIQQIQDVCTLINPRQSTFFNAI